jgi:hypothetical protein
MNTMKVLEAAMAEIKKQITDELRADFQKEIGALVESERTFIRRVIVGLAGDEVHERAKEAKRAALLLVRQSIRKCIKEEGVEDAVGAVVSKSIEKVAHAAVATVNKAIADATEGLGDRITQEAERMANGAANRMVEERVQKMISSIYVPSPSDIRSLVVDRVDRALPEGKIRDIAEGLLDRRIDSLQRKNRQQEGENNG